MSVVLRRVRRRVFAGMALVGASIACPAAKSEDVIEVLLDRALVIDMPPGAHTIVVGNPGIADVAVLRKQNRLVVTAKSFGETNMIALNADGAALTELIVRVKSADHMMIVQRGVERESYTCNPRCEPVVALGDAPRHTSETIGQSAQRNGFAGPAAGKP
jgi:hypothetical protein